MRHLFKRVKGLVGRKDEEKPDEIIEEPHWGVSDTQLPNYVRKTLEKCKDGLKMDVSFNQLISFIRKNPRYFHKLRCRPRDMVAFLPWKGNIGSMAYVRGRTPEEAVRHLKHALEVIPDGPWIENLFFCIKADGNTYAILDDTSHVRSILKVKGEPEKFLISYSLGSEKRPRSVSAILVEEDRYTLYPKKILDDKTIVDRHEKKVIA